mgnify:CR=1 FL=1
MLCSLSQGSSRRNSLYKWTCPMYGRINVRQLCSGSPFSPAPRYDFAVSLLGTSLVPRPGEASSFDAR